MTATYVGMAVATVLALGGWLTAQQRDRSTGQPIRAMVRLGTLLATLGLLLGVLTLPTKLPPETFAVGLASVLALGLLLTRGAAMRAVGWTSLGEATTTAVGLAWARPSRAAWSLLAAAAGFGLAGLLVQRGEPLAGLLGAALALAPARWWLSGAWRREQARTGVERAMAGALSGGLEWEQGQAVLRGAPVHIHFDRQHRPVRLSAPLPPQWSGAAEERLAEELGRRLSQWGTPWVTAVDHSAARRVTCARGEPLPERVDYAGQRPDGLRLPLGLARVSPAAALAGVGELGQVVAFYADLADSPSGLIVGSMGSGKSVLVRLIILLWCRWIGGAHLLDPKRVEFGIFRGRKGVRTVATTLEQIATVLAEVEAEMHRRFALMEAAGVQHVDDLAEHLEPLLTVCDEYFELVAKNPGNDDDTKAENEVRAQCASSARIIAALGRAAGIHILLLAQRADAEVVKGSLQNNLLLRALLRPLSAGPTARNMVGMNEVPVSENPKGRAVMKTAIWPESEVQVFIVEAADLDRYLPRVEQDEPSAKPEKPKGAGCEERSEQGMDSEGEVSASKRPKSAGAQPGKPSESAQKFSSSRPGNPGPVKPENPIEPEVDLGYDPMDYFDDEDGPEEGQ